MSKSVSPTAIGTFVIGAIILIVVSVLLFSSGNLFSKSYTVVAVFPGTVRGLTVGAPVEMRGVRIGSVTEITVLTDMKTKKITVPVYLEILRGSIKDMAFQQLSDQELTTEQWQQEVNSLIKAGLRGQLSLKSLVTGQLIVDVDFHPNTPINLTHVDTRYIELPTIETVTDRFINKLQELPIDALFHKTVKLIDDIDHLVSSKETINILKNVDKVTQETNELLAYVNAQAGPLNNSVQSVLTHSETTLKDISSLASNLDTQVKPLSDSAKAALDEGHSALAGIDSLVGEDSATRQDLENALNALAKAADSLRILAEYIEQHPEALIQGKGY